MRSLLFSSSKVGGGERPGTFVCRFPKTLFFDLGENKLRLYIINQQMRWLMMELDGNRRRLTQSSSTARMSSRVSPLMR